MSIALAIRKQDKLVIAADTQQNFGASTPCAGNMAHSKILQLAPGAYLASTGWGIYDNILEDYLTTLEEMPPLRNRNEVFSFFMELWQPLHDKYAFVNDQCEDKDSPFGDLDATFLIASAGRIFYASSHMSVTEFLKFHAIGSGCDYALGVMHALYDDTDPEDVARKALQAAVAHDTGCGGELEIITVPPT